MQVLVQEPGTGSRLDATGGLAFLVDLEKFLAYVGGGRLDKTDVFETTKTYTNDAGQTRKYTVTITAIPHRGYAIIASAEVSANTGFRKYGAMWASRVFNDLRAMEVPNEERAFTVAAEQNGRLETYVLMGIERVPFPIPRFASVTPLGADGATLLLERKMPDGNTVRWAEHNRSVWRTDPTGQIRSVDDFVKHLLSRPMKANLDETQPVAICIDGMVYQHQFPSSYMRFRVERLANIETANNLSRQIGSLEVISKNDWKRDAYVYEDLNEALAACGEYVNKKNIESSFTFVHPKFR